jgi:hypothetical protein
VPRPDDNPELWIRNALEQGLLVTRIYFMHATVDEICASLKREIHRVRHAHGRQRSDSERKGPQLVRMWDALCVYDRLQKSTTKLSAPEVGELARSYPKLSNQKKRTHAGFELLQDRGHKLLALIDDMVDTAKESPILWFHKYLG